MKITDLIIPGILLYLVYKDSSQNLTQTSIIRPQRLCVTNSGSIRNDFQLAPPPQAAVSAPMIDVAKIVKEVAAEFAKKPIELPKLLETAKVEPVRPDKDSLEAEKWSTIIQHPSLPVILGKRGSGKSCLSYRIAEHLRSRAPVYVVALPDLSKKYLPGWMGMVCTLEDLPNNSIGIVDEAYILYHSRLSMTVAAKEMSIAINLSRQKNQTIVFVSQDSMQIDRNILGAADVIIFKEPSLLQTKIDRPEIRSMLEKASLAFQEISGDRRKWAYVFSQAKGEIGLIESGIPTFWTDGLSRAFANSGESTPLAAKAVTLEERIPKAKEYHAQGLSLRQIAKLLGVSPATIKNYLDNYPYVEKRT